MNPEMPDNTVTPGVPPASPKAEWIERFRQIALYVVVIGVVIALTTIIAQWVHPR